MATIDVTGRQGRLCFGKAHIAAAPRDSITCSKFGLSEPVKGSDIPLPGKRHFGAEKTEYVRPTGKRVIEEIHELPIEELKRRSGRFGIKKVKPVAHHERPRAAVTETKPQANHTAEQKAELALKRMAERGVESAKAAVERPPASQDEVIRTERIVARDAAMAERIAHQSEHEGPPRPRTADFARAGNLNLPFATVRAQPLPPQRTVFSRKALHPPEKKEVVRNVRRQGHVDPMVTPFDTVQQGTPYPEPPLCGIQHRTHQSKKTCDGLFYATTSTISLATDIDSVSLARGARKAEYRGAVVPDRSQDFIFGAPPGPSQSMRCVGSDTRAMLTHHSGCGAGPSGEAAASAPKAGRGLSHHNQKTRLW